jgi:hypothetical protein
MAELPRYRRDGLLTAVAPQIQGVALQESARSSQALSQAMDRVSSFALKRMEQQAKVEGMQYGAANAPTTEQLAKAKASGQDIQDLLPGDQFTVFGSNARAVAVELITTNMETQALESISAIQTGFEAGTIGLAEMQERLVDIEDGYSSVLSDVSPGAAAKFRASIGATGNAAFLAAAKKQIAADKKQYEISQISRIDMSINGVRTIFDAGPRINEQGEMITPEDAIEVMREEILQTATKLEDPNFAATRLAQLDAERETAQVGLIIDAVQANPTLGLQALNGKVRLEDPAAQYILDNASPELKGVIFRELNAARANQLSREAQEERVVEAGRVKKSADLGARFSQALISNDPVVMDEVLAEMRTVDPDKWRVLSSAQYEGNRPDNGRVVMDLEYASYQGVLTADQLNYQMSEGNLSLSTYSRLLEEVKGNDDQSIASAMRIVRGAVGLPDAQSFGSLTMVDRQAMQDVAAIRTQLDYERRRNPGFDPIKFVEPLIEKVKAEKRDAASRTKANRAFSQASRRFPNQSAAAMLQNYLNLQTQNPGDATITRVIEGLEIYIDLESR